MGYLGSVIDDGIFHFHKVAQLHVAADAAVGTEIGEGADGGLVAHRGFIDLRGIDLDAVANDGIFQQRIGAHGAVFADNGGAAEDGAGQDLGAGADLDRGVDIAVVIVPDLHTAGGKAVEEEPLEDIGFQEKSETRILIEKFVDENPEATAALLRNWLNEEWE